MRDPIVLSGFSIVLGTSSVAWTFLGDFSEAFVIGCMAGTAWFVVNTALLTHRRKR